MTQARDFSWHNGTMYEHDGELVTWVDVDLPEWVKVGFTDRHGGVSRGDFDSLNLGFHVGDDPEDVAANRHELERYLGSSIVWMSQTHSDVVRDAAHWDEGARGFPSVGEADGMIIDRGHVHGALAMAVMVADCVPLLLVDPVGQRAGVVHVGRAGMDLEIAVRAIEQMVGRGSTPGDILAVVGPSICGECYEVDEKLATDVGSRHQAARVTTRWGTPGIDVAAGLKAQLDRAGVRVMDTRACTYEDRDFYSHRRATHEDRTAGRFVGVVRLDPSGNTPRK